MGTVQITNNERDIKRFSVYVGDPPKKGERDHRTRKEYVLGSKDDEGKDGALQPTITVSDEEWKAIRALPVMTDSKERPAGPAQGGFNQRALKRRGWLDTKQVVVSAPVAV